MLVLTNIGKGGGGKTSTAINLAVVATSHGLTVGMLDADPQASLCQWRGVRASADIRVVPCGASPVDEALRAARRLQLDWLIIDTAPALGENTLCAIRAADMVLIPMRPAVFDLGVTQRRVETLRSMRRRFAIVLNSAPPRREGLDSPIVREAREALNEVGARLWLGQITHRHSILTALIQGQGVAEAEPAGPAAAEYRRLWAAVANSASNSQTQRISA